MKKWILLFSIFPLSLLANQVSLVLKDAPTAEVVAYLASEMDKNIVLHQDIESKSNIRIENSQFDAILKSIAKINKLNIQQENGVYYISEKTKEDLNEKIKPLDEEQKPQLVTRTVKLKYAKASEVIDSLTKGSGSFLNDGGYIHFDERSNSLIIKENTASIKNTLALIKELDKPTEQIAIEARIVTISSKNLQELGVRWGMFSADSSIEEVARNGGRVQNLNVNFPVVAGASATLQVASINSKLLDLELSALEQENSVEIIASPRLLTTNKKLASIKQGTEIPYAIYDRKSETYDISFKEAVLGLEVTPHISENNQILMDLIVTQNSQGQSVGNANSGNTAIAIDKQELNTQVFAKHGETIVLGGVFQHLKSKDSDKIPVLGSIPFLKRLFSYQKDQINKRELVIFVTPYIVQSKDVAADFSKTKEKSPKR
ncbi:type IV pilus secretin PilQ [Haemophilus paraphrohaemolyticus]|uniref:Type IV pilus secretin PilQ n=1 Tax=Haemophilus paraphrohaemolyticus HK411 TaxID=1095743 RepID=I2NCE1_9PAST|nr:type IV pilus secretin PilQ [Haemophilus paraphrohaemolyticus]EIG23502.1 type IV pilus secretin PilQ [Haemophilus paraphrohaemolyticus HK411]OOR96359.1 secretin [Haemophilus paraphrohaemolyticus]STP01161.1 Type IV pilus biogenesis and competence protein pilQ precursor [Haemophilus paraphrohaemolyticus]